jgi:uroporphyrinogen-III synthase
MQSAGFCRIIQTMKPANTLFLVTRTNPDGQSLLQKLGELGEDAVHCPPVRLSGPDDPGSVAAQLLELLPVDRIIATSAEALRQAVALIGPTAFADTPTVVPGPGTARVARQLGLSKLAFPEQGGTSEAMLTLPELDQVNNFKVLILAAAGGRRLLESRLRERSARVKRVHVYQRHDQPLPDDLEDRILVSNDLVTLISSGGALEALHRQLSKNAWHQLAAGRVVVPSERVMQLACKLDCQQVINALGADDAAMLRSLGIAT